MSKNAKKSSPKTSHDSFQPFKMTLAVSSLAGVTLMLFAMLLFVQ